MLSAAHRRRRLLGIPVDCLDAEQALQQAALLLQGDRPCSIIAINPEKIMFARSNPMLREVIEQSGLLIPDGIGVVMALRWLKLGHCTRVPGADLMPELCALASQQGHAIFLFGAKESVSAKASTVLQRRYPGLTIAGRQNGYVRSEDMPALVARINASGARILFLALGSPAQELWMQHWMPQLQSVRLVQGIGGTLDVLAGHVRRAPLWSRQAHLEWAWRLASNPSRLFRQTALPRFVWLIMRERALLHKRAS